MLNQYAEKEGLKMGKVAQPLRAALTGTTASPGIYEVRLECALFISFFTHENAQFMTEHCCTIGSVCSLPFIIVRVSS
jgi:hypothetical protein